ncbi:MAG: WD40 repeat domain-containing serine/threonine protein kinase [Gemmataceae bacterium]
MTSHIMERDLEPRRMHEAPKIPGYRLLRELGRGGMGVVHLARCEQSQAVVAVKFFVASLGVDEADAQRRFKREIGAISLLRHPNIVRVHDSGRFGSLQYLVMEYIQGVELSQLLHQSGPLPLELVCELMRQAASGLQHAHDQGIVHRDVKPANIMLTPVPGNLEAPYGTVKILDLGLARLVGSDHGLSASSLTHEGMVIGTPDYIAPEQVESSHEVDHRADIYSLGCTFYELLTGQVPYPDMNVMDKLDRHRWSRPRPMELIRREIPRALADIVRKMMHKEPADRYASMNEFLTALQQWTEGASQPTVVEMPKTLRFAGRNSEERVDMMRLALAEMLDRKAFVDARQLVEAMLQRNANDTLALAVRNFISDHEQPVGEVACLNAHSGNLHGLAYLPHGESFLVVGDKGLIAQWDAKALVKSRSLAGHLSAVKSVAVNHDGSLAATAGEDGKVLVWDLPSGRAIKTCRGRGRFSVNSLAFAPNGQHFASASSDGCVRLWNAASGERLQRFEHAGDAKSVNFSADGQSLLTSSWDHTVRLWQIESGQEIRRFDGFACLFQCAAISCDGRRVLAAGSEQCVHIWDAESGAEVGRLEGHAGWVNCLALSADGRLALTGGRDQAVRLWDLETCQELACFTGHTNWPTCVAFAPSGRHALSSGRDGTLRYWHLPWA